MPLQLHLHINEAHNCVAIRDDENNIFAQMDSKNSIFPFQLAADKLAFQIKPKIK